MELKFHEANFSDGHCLYHIVKVKKKLSISIFTLYF